MEQVRRYREDWSWSESTKKIGAGKGYREDMSWSGGAVRIGAGQE